MDSSNPVPVEEKTRVVLAPKWLGKRVGRFKLLSLLGQGAMGRVFRAEDTLMQRHVALKLLPRTVKRGKRSVGAEMLIREARAAGSIEHPNAVQIYEINEAGDVYYIAMELLEGGSLRDLVKAAGPLDPSRACMLAAEAAEALAVAHSLGVVHRDVKPANLMLSRSGRCKVVDFGLARVDDPSDLTNFLAESVGTPQFIAPEILRGTPASAQSDIYSLGGTLWYLLTGRPPFEAGTAQELLHKHLDCPLPDLRAFRPGVPQELSDALAIALAKDPSDRYSSMDQFAKVLRIHSIPIAGSASNLSGMAGERSSSLNRPSSPLEASQSHLEVPEMETVAPARRPKWPLFAGLGAAGALLLIVGGIVLLRPPKASSDKPPGDSAVTPTTPTSVAPVKSVEAPVEPAEVLPRTLVAQWVADDFSSGGNWIDRSQKIVATSKNSPVLVPAAFNGHPGVSLNGKDQYFTLSADDYPITQGNSFTVAAVFKPNRGGDKSTTFWRGLGIVGGDLKGTVGDWALAIGGPSGVQLVAGGGNFPMKQDGGVHSDSIELNRTHVAVMTFQFTGKPKNTATMTLYVDGMMVAEDTKPSEARSKRIPLALGAMSADGAKPFSGLLAEIRIYDDATEDVNAISERLLKTYTNPRSDGEYNGSDLNNLLHR
jgi:serine/threonine protein kinase